MSEVKTLTSIDNSSIEDQVEYIIDVLTKALDEKPVTTFVALMDLAEYLQK